MDSHSPKRFREEPQRRSQACGQGGRLLAGLCASNIRAEPPTVSPLMKPEKPKRVQHSCRTFHFLLRSFSFPGAKTARERFFSLENGLFRRKIIPHPPYTPPGTIESSRDIRPSRFLQGLFDSLSWQIHVICRYGHALPK